MTYDNIKSHKKQGFTFSLKNIVLEKPQGEVKLNPPTPNPQAVMVKSRISLFLLCFFGLRVCFFGFVAMLLTLVCHYDSTIKGDGVEMMVESL